MLEARRAAARLGDVVSAVEAASPDRGRKRGGIAAELLALFEAGGPEPVDERCQERAAIGLSHARKHGGDDVARFLPGLGQCGLICPTERKSKG
jgi:hypothetical protein